MVRLVQNCSMTMTISDILYVASSARGPWERGHRGTGDAARELPIDVDYILQAD